MNVLNTVSTSFLRCPSAWFNVLSTSKQQLRTCTKSPHLLHISLLLLPNCLSVSVGAVGAVTLATSFRPHQLSFLPPPIQQCTGECTSLKWQPPLSERLLALPSQALLDAMSAPLGNYWQRCTSQQSPKAAVVCCSVLAQAPGN